MPFFSARPNAIFNVRSRRISLLPFLTRQVLTVGYVVAGYKDTVTWLNVNRVANSTDITTNLGNLLSASGSYIASVHNKNSGYLFGVNGTGTQGWGAFNGATAWNMRNETTKSTTAGMTPYSAVGQMHGIMNHNQNGDADFGWYTGNHTSNILARFTFATESHTASTATAITNGAGDSGGGSAGCMDELFGVWTTDTQQYKYTFATQTESNYSSAFISAHHQQKHIHTKLGFAYGGNEGSYNAGNSLRKHNFTTQTNVSVVAKPVTNSGEENFTMGQAHQYMLGMYNGAQNNIAWRFNYSTDSGFQGGASMQPTGSASGHTGATTANIEGRSSGVGMWRD